MRIVVPVKVVPDLVEELEIDAGGTDVDREFMKFVLNEYDEQALEEALLLKEAGTAEVVVVALDEPDVDQGLYTALAKGADRAVKLTGVPDGWIDTHTRAAILAAWLAQEPFDLVLTGVQAADDLDGQLPSLLGARLGRPHVSVVVRVEAKDASVLVRQEFSAGRATELEVALPAVIGVQAARQAPRYASITRVRQAMQEAQIVEVPATSGGDGPGLEVRRLYAPEVAGHAEMLEGTPAEVAGRIVELLRAKGVVRG
jgi:electron transfer flavoprotein beta subunit